MDDESDSSESSSIHVNPNLKPNTADSDSLSATVQTSRKPKIVRYHKESVIVKCPKCYRTVETEVTVEWHNRFHGLRCCSYLISTLCRSCCWAVCFLVLNQDKDYCEIGCRKEDCNCNNYYERQMAYKHKCPLCKYHIGSMVVDISSTVAD